MEERRIRIDAAALSPRYAVRELTEADVERVYRLCLGNPLYYRHCPPPVTRESVRAGMRALPPRTTYDDKSYLGFFEGDELVAVMDLIVNYPNTRTAFIGLFMMARSAQGKGIGSRIVGECAEALRRAGCRFIRLGYVKGNPQSEAFWKKNGFEPVGIETDQGAYTVVVMEKAI